MVTKDPKLRADWSEIFAYEVRNGELYRKGAIRDKSSNNMKGSFTNSDTSTTNTGGHLTASKDLRSTLQSQASDLIYSPRPNNELRSTYTAKSPFR